MRRLITHTALMLFVCALSLSAMAAQEKKMLCDFETDDELKLFEFKKPKELVDKHATSGAKSVMIQPGEYMVNYRTLKWDGYESVDIDVFVEGAEPVAVTLVVRDQHFAKKPSYWNRHNGGYNLRPGENTISIPVNGLYRGEAGSRNNDLKTNIDPTALTQFELGFNCKDANARIYVDNVRLIKEIRPEGILAFDFGPESQTVFPGFTPISWNTVYGQNGNKAGMKRAGWGKSLARDDTFPTRLYQDWVEMGADQNCREFVADVPNGKYHVWVMFTDCGYWGGEQAKHKRRSISTEGTEAYVDDRGEKGPVDYLYRFENIEPKPGDSIWDLYMKDLFQPRRFEVTVADGALNLVFNADAGWSSKVSAIIIYPDANKAEAEKWVAEVEARNKKEFEDRALCMGPKPQKLEVPAAAAAKGYWLGFPAFEKYPTLADAPGAPDGKLSRVSARNQRVSFTFAVRPLKDFSPVALTCTDLAGPGGTIPQANLDLRYVSHGTARSFNAIAYQIVPQTLRRVEGSKLQLAKDLTRQFWITVHTPADAKPGVYTGQVTLAAGALKETLPLSVDVQDFTLDEPEFTFGFYGVWAPPGRLKDAFTLLKQNGMNSFTGGPGIKFDGLDENGKPKLDFSKCDEFFKLVKECGFTKELWAYGGPGMVDGLHDGYVIGATGKKWEQQTGKPFKDLLKIVWTAVKEHADKEGWPPIAYGFCDEPRVLESAREQVELMKAYREAVPFVRVGGSYSVHWGDSELDKAIQEIFKTLVWSGLNTHTETDMQKAKEFGREIYIYNQGLSRYSFGLYQWAEMCKGVKSRMQWHSLCLHGYQFFDLDGREPDTAAYNWTEKEPVPTVALPQCREGADDFRYAVTLWNLAQKKKDSPDAKAALAFLDEINTKIAIQQRDPPPGIMDNEAFRMTCVQHIRKLQAAK
jgi:hypothetical protein